MMRSRVSILASSPNSPNLLGDVDAHRAPGYATTAANTSRTAELVNPGGQLVSHPLAIACFGGGSDTASVNIGKALCEAGIPAAPAFGVISGNVSYIFHRDAKACGADHRAVGTRQATAGHVVPARMLKVLVEKLFDASGIDATHLLARRRFHPRSGFLAVFCGSRNRFQLSQYLGAAIATDACVHCTAMMNAPLRCWSSMGSRYLSPSSTRSCTAIAASSHARAPRNA